MAALRQSLITKYHQHVLPTIEWNDDGIVMIDQRKLPAQRST